MREYILYTIDKSIRKANISDELFKTLGGERKNLSQELRAYI
jgi:hypothetical protein